MASRSSNLAVVARRNLEKGNLVNWDTAKFDTINMIAYEVAMDSVCYPVSDLENYVKKLNGVYCTYYTLMTRVISCSRSVPAT